MDLEADDGHSLVSSYLCQYGSSPGILTLSPSRLKFIPVGRSDSVIVYELADIRSVKKIGLLGGLALRYENNGSEQEAKFSWVTKRDEVFSRLVGWGSRR